METRAHHVIIGLFTLLGLGLALAFGLWLAKSGNDRDTLRYRVVFSEPVSGLTEGSLVQYNGLRVGEVSRLQLDPQDPRRVWADIEVSQSTPVNQGTRARQAIANITGAANILLSSGALDAPPLAGEGGEPPVIVADPSPFGALLGSSEALLAGVGELVERGTELLSRDNIDRIGRILEDLEQLSQTLAASRTSVVETLSTMNATLDETRGVVAQTREALAREGVPMLASGRRAMASLERSSQQLERLLARHEQRLDAGLGSVGEIAPLMQDLQRGVATLNRILQRLEEDPAGYLRGRPPLGEFEP